VTIVFKDLKKLVSQQQKENTRKELFERLQGKSFWIWDKQQHKLKDIRTDGDCCFNHIIGPPQKDGNGNKHLWIKKATGLGVSEFMLRFMAWLCLKYNGLSYQSSFHKYICPIVIIVSRNINKTAL
jgi:hypothetical protein